MTAIVTQDHLVTGLAARISAGVNANYAGDNKLLKDAMIAQNFFTVAQPTTPVVTGVTSFNTRSGAVVLTRDDITGVLTTPLPIANGGTGATTATAAINALLPGQTGNGGKVLSTNGNGALAWVSLPTAGDGTATQLATARTIAATGDASWSVTFNGSANVSAALTLANSGVTAGSGYREFSVDAKGRVTAAGKAFASLVEVALSSAANVGTAGASPFFMMTNTGAGGSFMSFHRAGAYAINLGLRTDNVFALGGWSAGENNYRFTSDAVGNFVATGDVTAFSDIRLKTDWQPLADDFVLRLSELQHGTYKRIDTGARQAGVSAQELEKLLPEAVLTDAQDHKSVAYGNAALVSAVALADYARRLEERVTALEGAIDSLRSAGLAR